MTSIIDAHHHVWDPTRADYPWMTDDVAAIRRRFGLDDLAPELAAAGIDATVVVQARAALEETEWLLDLAAGDPVVRGVVGWVDLTDPAIVEVLSGLLGTRGGDRLVGVRHQVHDEPDPEWLRRADVGRGLDAVGGAGLAYDLLVRARELPAAEAVARRRPTIRFVVDHLAKPPIAAGDWGMWASGLQRLAALPNVTAKLSGLVTEAHWDRWTIDDLRPAVDLALEAFGPDRLMFGSDWPVCRLAATYATVVATARDLTGGLSAAERSAIFGGTAERIYRLDAGS